MGKRAILTAALLTMLVSFAGISAGADNLTIDTLGTTAFLYGSNSYVPLQSVASFLGAELQWDAANGRAVIAYDGKEFALTPGSRNALFEGRPVVLSAAPGVANGRVFLPTEALKRFYGIPVTWDQAKSELRIKGPSGWGAVTVSRRPPPGWHQGRKTGWGKHGDVTRPPGLSKKQGPPSAAAVAKAGAKSPNAGKGRAGGRRGR